MKMWNVQVVVVFPQFQDKDLLDSCASGVATTYCGGLLECQPHCLGGIAFPPNPEDVSYFPWYPSLFDIYVSCIRCLEGS